MDIKYYLMIALGIALIVGGIWISNLYNEYQELLLEKQKVEQNEAALKDSIEAVRGELVKTTSFVRKLNEEKESLEKRYVALSISFKSYVDSVTAHGGATVVESDSQRVYTFAGQDSLGLIGYNGNVKHDLRTNEKTHRLSFSWLRPFESGATLIQENGIWKWEIRSLTPGVTVLGTGVLDDDTYRKLQKYGPPEPTKHFLIGGYVGSSIGPMLGYRADDWVVLGGYAILNSKDQPIQNIQVNLLWNPF